jgi:UDP-N-acetylglucosamine 2-epimerase
MKNWKNPFGDGRAGERIVEILEKSLKIQVKTNI